MEILQENPQNAIEYYNLYLRNTNNHENPNEISARINLGFLYERILAYQDAAKEYAHVLDKLMDEINPNSPKPYLIAIPFQYARIYKYDLGNGSYKAAVTRASKVYQDMLQRWPNSKAALLALNYVSLIMLQNKDYSRLQQILDEQLQITQDTTILARLQFLQAKIMLAQHVDPATVIRQLQRIITNYPDSEIIAAVKLELAKAYLQQQRFEKTRLILKDILNNYLENFIVAAEAQEQLALSFELEGRWDQALNEYRWLSKQFETSLQGLTAPLKIANYYLQQNNIALADQAFNEAIEFYQELVRKYPSSILAAMAQEQISKCFMAQRKYEEAIGAVKKIKEIWSNSAGVISTYLLLGKIYEASNQYSLAARAYKEIATQFPQHPLAPLFDEKARQLLN
ncbi:MAG: tetratricopeptide repeat protein [candidate division KSB1 bacterium]|nr:tetratricopeptide repeat protein [candidate division KSB1 bacterium]